MSGAIRSGATTRYISAHNATWGKVGPIPMNRVQHIGFLFALNVFLTAASPSTCFVRVQSACRPESSKRSNGESVKLVQLNAYTAI